VTVNLATVTAQNRLGQRHDPELRECPHRSGADNVTGDGNDNIFFDGGGADTYNGGGADGTVDYSASRRRSRSTSIPRTRQRQGTFGGS
jgi:hypothetical protein